MYRRRFVICTVASAFIMMMTCGSLSAADELKPQIKSADEIMNQLAPPEPKADPELGEGRGASRIGSNAKANIKPVKRSMDFDIRFDFNSSRVSSVSEAQLEELVKVLKSDKLSNKAISIIGHTDARGSEEFNMRLSEKRAEAVVNWLTKRGVNRSTLKPLGMGKYKLKNEADPESPENRRVEVAVN